MFNLFKRKQLTAPEPQKQVAKVFRIDPVNQSIAEIAHAHISSLVSTIVGDDADCYKLDNHDNVVWMSDTDTNKRFAYSWDGMPYPFDVKRFSKALVVSLGPDYWSVETINDWILWYDRDDPWNP